MTKTALFLKLARPDKNGVSRWVTVSEFVNEYPTSQVGNGGGWCRGSSTLSKRYSVETNKSLSSGNSIDAIRLNGFNTKKSFNQSIRQAIKCFYKNQKCVMLGINGDSENTNIEIDHKDGRKNDWRVSAPSTQSFDDFQPLCKAANDVKRQICKSCKETATRRNAKNIQGNPYPFYAGDAKYTEKLGRKGCYQYDPVEYRKISVRRISKEAAEATAEAVYLKLYPEDEAKADIK